VNTRSLNQPVHTRRVIVLGSTGSIGVQTLEVIDHLNAQRAAGSMPPAIEVVGLGAGTDKKALLAQANAHTVRDLSLCELRDDSEQAGIRLRAGAGAARRLVEEVECDLVVGAIVGVAGLDSTLGALELGRDVALANKESLVAAGSLVINAARESGASILPLDSEHAGVWQCLQSFVDTPYCPPTPAPKSVSRVILTASGGAFGNKSRQEIFNASLDEALLHPNWSMGSKVTIDSATLMNKALELIEAHWLFGLGADQLGAVIHPQSVIHAFVESTDSSIIAQLGAPDMKLPIHAALCHPARQPSCAQRLDVSKLTKLDFVEIDPDRFPAINLAIDSIRRGGTSGAMLNAANEHAVHAFMNSRIEFGRIDLVVAQVLGDLQSTPITSIDDVYQADKLAREEAEKQISAKAGGLK
jgi:1-deoxy-D-xylulose-5-phosphate reductoisomerase